MKKKIMCKKEKEKTGSECICVWRWFYPLWLNSNQLAAKTEADLTGAFLPHLSLTSLFTQVKTKSVPNAVIILKLVGYPSFFGDIIFFFKKLTFSSTLLCFYFLLNPLFFVSILFSSLLSLTAFVLNQNTTQHRRNSQSHTVPGSGGSRAETPGTETEPLWE